MITDLAGRFEETSPVRLVENVEVSTLSDPDHGSGSLKGAGLRRRSVLAARSRPLAT
jgi:hypothetical protein